MTILDKETTNKIKVLEKKAKALDVIKIIIKNDNETPYMDLFEFALEDMSELKDKEKDDKINLLKEVLK